MRRIFRQFLTAKNFQERSNCPSPAPHAATTSLIMLWTVPLRLGRCSLSAACVSVTACLWCGTEVFLTPAVSVSNGCSSIGCTSSTLLHRLERFLGRRTARAVIGWLTLFVLLSSCCCPTISRRALLASRLPKLTRSSAMQLVDGGRSPGRETNTTFASTGAGVTSP